MDGLCKKQSHILYITQVLYIIHMYIMLNLFNATIRFFILMQIILDTFYWGDGRIDSLLQSVEGPRDSTLGSQEKKLTTKKNIKECVWFLLLLGFFFPNPSDYYLLFILFFFFFLTWVVSNEKNY